jgi:hypothetical protein
MKDGTRYPPRPITEEQSNHPWTSLIKRSIYTHKPGQQLEIVARELSSPWKQGTDRD